MLESHQCCQRPRSTLSCFDAKSFLRCHGAGTSFQWDACLSSRRHCRKVYEAAHTHTHTRTAWAMLPLTFINKPTEGKRTEKQNARERERHRDRQTDSKAEAVAARIAR